MAVCYSLRNDVQVEHDCFDCWFSGFYRLLVISFVCNLCKESTSILELIGVKTTNHRLILDLLSRSVLIGFIFHVYGYWLRFQIGSFDLYAFFMLNSFNVCSHTEMRICICTEVTAWFWCSIG